MKLGPTERSLAIYTGILTVALSTAYAGGLAARAGNAERDVRRAPVALPSRSLSSLPEEAALSSVLLGGAATVSQHPSR